MDVKIKKLHPDAIIPTYAKPGDVGMDISAVDDGSIIEYGPEYPGEPAYIEYRTGLAFEIPEGHFMQLVMRSSGTNKPMILKNCLGIIDSGFRAEVRFRFMFDPNAPKELLYKKGDRIGQLIILPYPQVRFVAVPQLSESARGGDGFGSTGK